MSLKEKIIQLRTEEKQQSREDARRRAEEEKRQAELARAGEERKMVDEAQKGQRERELREAEAKKERERIEELLLPARQRLEDSGVLKMLKEARKFLKNADKVIVFLQPKVEKEGGVVISESSYATARLTWNHPRLPPIAHYSHGQHWNYIEIKAPLTQNSLSIETGYQPVPLHGPQKRRILFSTDLTSLEWKDRDNLERVLAKGFVATDYSLLRR